MSSEVAPGQKPAVLIIGGLGMSLLADRRDEKLQADVGFQDTQDETSRSTYTITTLPPKFVSSISTSQSWHGLHQSSRKLAQESASYKQMRRKKVRITQFEY